MSNKSLPSGAIFAKFASRYAAQGFEVFPLAPGTKEPLKNSHGLKDATSDMRQISEWAKLCPFGNIGLRTGSGSDADVIDIDPDKGGFETEAAFRKQRKFLPNRAVGITRSGGRHLWVKHHPLIRTGTNRLGKGIDFRGEGGYIVAPGSVVDGKRYRFLCWPGKHLLPDVPSWILDEIRAKQVVKEPRQAPPLTNLAEDEDRVRDALQYISSDGYDEWVKVGMALRSEFGEKGRQLWDAWASQSQKYDVVFQERKWRSFNGVGVNLGTIFALRQGGRVRFYDL